ncbi:MAG: PAS domain S-box protein [Proteobacteria bacterium]|nr:PAS domain S-box protein [Pseudomonadota bacterium]
MGPIPPSQPAQPSVSLYDDRIVAGKFLGALPAAAIIVDEGETVVAANTRAENMLGCTAATAVGRPIDGAYKLFLDRARRAAGHEATNFVQPFGLGWYMIYCFPLQLGSMSETWTVVSAFDITAMKNAEFEIRESEARLEEATRIAQLGTYKIFWQTASVQWSPHMYVIHGVSPAAITHPFGKYRNLVHPEDHETFERIFTDQLDGKAVRGAEYRIIRADGTVRWLRFDARVLFDADGEPYASFGTCQDVTEGKQREQELKQLLRRNAILYEALDASPIGVAVVTTDRAWPEVFYANAEFERLTGFNTSSLSAHGIASLRALDESGAGWDAVLRTFATSTSGAFELTCARRDGTSFLAQVEVAPVSDYPGRDATVFVLNLDDVTADRERAGQLLQSQKMEALGQLSGGVAHEINNLLQPILALADLGQDFADKDPGKVRKYFEIIASSARKARDVVRQILTFARRDAPQLAPHGISGLVADALNLLQSGLPPGIVLDQQLQADGAIVVVNPTQVSQVVLNLVTNAADAMGGQGKVSVRLASVDIDAARASALTVEPGTWVELSVIDRGCGMDSYTLSRIFEPFYTTKVAGKGTGLGLSVVYSIVTGWGGTLKVESEVDQGTKAMIYIPTASSLPSTQVSS